MSHVKSGGATAQQSTRRGKRLGVKKFGGQKVISGNIIIRQNGTKVHAGDGVRVGRDYTLYSVREGVVNFYTRLGKSFVSVK